MASHAELNCRGFRDICEEDGLHEILLDIGGNLVPAGSQKWSEVEAILSSAHRKVYIAEHVMPEIGGWQWSLHGR